MTIATADETYIVLNTLDSKYGIERMVCLIDGQEEKRVLLIKISNKDYIISSMLFFAETAKNDNFTDYIKYFSSNGNFYMVFRYNDGVKLSERIKDAKFEEKLSIVKAIVDNLIIQNIPYYFANYSLTVDNVTLDENNVCTFLYNVDKPDSYKEIELEDVTDRFRELIEFIFAAEFKIESVPRLETYIKDLRRHNYDSIMDLYSDFMKLYEELMKLDKGEAVIPKTRGFRRWKEFMSRFKYVKTAIVLILIVVAIVYLILTIGNVNAKGKGNVSIKSIGTVELNPK